MLNVLLRSQYPRFEMLADAWLKMGAASFGVWQKGSLLAAWPTLANQAQPGLVATIRFKDQVVGDLRVAGIHGPAAHARLLADAELIAQLIIVEDEIQGMAADLVTTQDQLVALYRFTNAMSRYLTIDETLHALLAEVTRLIKARAGFALFAPPEKEPLVVQYPELFLDETILWHCFWQAFSETQEVALTTTSMAVTLVDDVYDLLFIPIRTRDMVIAGLGLLNPAGTGFTTAEIKLAHAIANQASAQIEKVLLYQAMLDQAKFQAEMDLARRVQSDLLPKRVPAVPGLDLFARARPASQVGGDFYDFIYQPGRPFIFSVGDVSGKGISAALLMTMTRTAIHSKAYFMPDPTPRAVIRQSNEDLYDDFTQVGVFATAFVGQYHALTRTLLFANAGHSPVIYRPAGDVANLLIAENTAIGVFPVNACENQAIVLGPDDLLVVATDGFCDARSPADETFGYDRLLQLVDTVAAKSASEIAAALFDAVDRFSSGCPQEDDQTLVVVKGVAA